MKTTIGILGVGAIGSVVAAHLNVSSSTKIYYYNRSPRKNIRLKYNNFMIEKPIVCQTKLMKTVALDWLVICLKEHQYEEARDWLREIIKPSTKVAVIRNGVDLKTSVIDYCSVDSILEVSIDCPTQYNKDGYYEQLRQAKLTVPEGALGHTFSILFQCGGLVIKSTPDFKTASWEKLCESAALGAVLCLSGTTCWIFKDQAIQNFYRILLREAIEVALADGAQITNGFEQKMLAKVLEYPPHKSSSMLADRQNGKRIELGAKNGIIVELGKRYQIATPMNTLVVNLLRNTNVKQVK